MRHWSLMRMLCFTYSDAELAEELEAVNNLPLNTI